MLNGALATFQRMWELVGSVCESAKMGQFDKNDKDYKKLSAELYSTRNSQLAMVANLHYLRLSFMFWVK